MDFEVIYQSYCKDVFRYLRSLSAGEDLAEEITQETFAKALKAIDQFQGDKDIRAWLFTRRCLPCGCLGSFPLKKSACCSGKRPAGPG